MKRAPAGGLDPTDQLRRFLVELNRLELASQLVFIIKPTGPRRSGFDPLKMLRVNCSDGGHVIGLNLNNESISGGLNNSSSLFHLQYLQNLSLAYNNFNSSRIPLEFGNLTNLIYLNLSNAGFAGARFPLRFRRLDKNLSELKELYLDGVNISAQGNEWCQAISSSLPNLRVLSMSDCNLSGPLDSSLQNLPFLSIIRLDNNNFLLQFQNFFANFTNLTSLHLSSCGLNGSFPEKIFQVQTLQTLDLSNNGLLYGSLPEFHPNGSLRSLLLSGTKFSGALPDSIGNLKMLSRIDLSSCNFSGSIPKLYGKPYSIGLFGLVRLLPLTGKIFRILLTLTCVPIHLNGSIPVSLFSLPSLQKLQLSNNQFSGRLNDSSVSSYSLDTLDLSSNNLEGSIPTSVFELRSLSVLDLHSNQLEGELPVLPPIATYLDFSRNNFNSAIPANIPQGKQFNTFSNDSYEGNKGLCGVPLKTNCTSDKAPPPPATPNLKAPVQLLLIGFDWQFILTGLGYGVGAAVVVAPLMFWEKGRKWHDDSIDKVLLVILPMIGLSYTGCNNFKVEAEEDIEDENTDDCEDDDDDDEMEDEEFRGRYRIITPGTGMRT
uniref:Leucine-rich repeat-containing N-terminal plant-type domain-containing protein n=1 Tax=Fagus sylvatica TaxID=28930 RepID=A0A2N9G593_FAGSY